MIQLIIIFALLAFAQMGVYQWPKPEVWQLFSIRAGRLVKVAVSAGLFT